MADNRLNRWLEQVYATGEGEIDCEQLQTALPAYVELEVASGDAARHFPQIHAHLAHCPDCAEEYKALLAVVKLEAEGRLPEVEESLAQFDEAERPEPSEQQQAVA